MITENNTLIHHGVGIAGMTTEQMTEAARDHGILWLCLGCGSVCAVPAGMTTTEWKDENSEWFDSDLHAEWAECCPNSNSILY